MKNAFLLSLFLLFILSGFSQGTKPAARLEKLWESEPGLKIPESVLYDTATGIIFVSSIDGNPGIKDSTGFISTLSPEGKILDAAWITGIDAPKGMGILKNHLFVSNIDEVIEIDIKTASILKRHQVEGAKFLNDIAVDAKTGMIFITDSFNGEVYVLFNEKASLWLQGPMFKGANGLCLSDSLLFIGTGTNILQADILKGEVIVFVPKTGGVDGLYVTSGKDIIYSDWKGSVFFVGLNRKPELILNTSDQKINAADFGVISSRNMILIPTFGNNKVVCYTSPLVN